jgi:hypothetical protein
MTVRPYSFIETRRLARRVDSLDQITSGTYVVTRPGFSELVAPPDFVADPTDSDGIGNGRDFGFSLTDFKLEVEDAFLARFDDVLIDRYTDTPVTANTYNVFPAEGLALAETYGTAHANRILTGLVGEVVQIPFGGQTIETRLYNDEPVDQLVQGGALLIASRFTLANYYHWMMDAVPRLWVLDLFQDKQQVPLLTPGYTLPGFATETFKALGITNPLVPLNCHMARVASLYFPSFHSPGGYSRDHVTTLSDRLRRAFGVADVRPDRLIYISRNDAGSRHVANEAEVMALLAPMGFEVVTLSKMSVPDQAKLFASARLVVAPHGAGNTNLLFASRAAGLIEVLPQGSRNPCYWLLTKQNGQRYGRMLSPGDGTGDLVVDVVKLAALLKQAGI